MNKRFIWNFEFKCNRPLCLPSCNNELLEEGIHWESRFFWPENEVIVLSNLNEPFLHLSQYAIRDRCDHYYLLPDSNFNIKFRREQFLYKKIHKTTKLALAYQKKIILEDYTGSFMSDTGETYSSSALIKKVKQQGKCVQVDKEALIYKFPKPLHAKLEFARLRVGKKFYFSLCIESRYLSNVEYLVKEMIHHHQPCDYVTFLKGIG